MDFLANEMMMYYAGSGSVVLLLAFILFKYFQKKKEESARSYFEKGDPKAQEQYVSDHSPLVVLTKDEKVELSWQFLYELSDKVLREFSQEDQDKLAEIGRKMHDNGIHYDHIINYGIRREYIQELERELAAEKKQTEQNRRR